MDPETGLDFSKDIQLHLSDRDIRDEYPFKKELGALLTGFWIDTELEDFPSEFSRFKSSSQSNQNLYEKGYYSSS